MKNSTFKKVRNIICITLGTIVVFGLTLAMFADKYIKDTDNTDTVVYELSAPTSAELTEATVEIEDEATPLANRGKSSGILPVIVMLGIIAGVTYYKSDRISKRVHEYSFNG